MQYSSDLSALFQLVLPRIHFFLVCVGGLVFALLQLSAHRQPALLVLLGSGALLTGFVLSVGMNYLVMQRAHGGGSSAEIGAILSIVGIVQALLSACGYALLIWAAFADRAHTSQPEGGAPSPAGR